MRILPVALLMACAACSRAPQAPLHQPPALHNDPQALAYRSRAPVADADAKLILAQTVSAARAQAPWAEAAHMHGSDGPIGDGKAKFLFGEARLFLVEYETETGKFREVDAREDATMAWSDAQQLYGLLARWSRDHGVQWDVQLGTLRGGVDARGPDAEAREILALLAQQSGAQAAELAAERARLDAKYRDRRE